jgi:hypothetical protein
MYRCCESCRRAQVRPASPLREIRATAFIEVILDVALGRLQTDQVECAIVQFVRGDTAAVQLAAGRGL